MECEMNKKYIQKRAFLNYAWIFKVYAMVEWPRMFCNIWSVCTRLDIPDVFFLAGFKGSAGFTYIAPITLCTGYFVNHVRLMFDRWSKFGRRKFLLQSLEGLLNDQNLCSILAHTARQTMHKELIKSGNPLRKLQSL